MTSNAISVRGLRKSYGDHVALDDVDFDVPAGSVFALLGPNGSGKSTTVNVLSTLIGADAGRVEVGGHDVSRSPMEVRAAIGVSGQQVALDPWLTGRENLRLMVDLHHLRRRESIERVNRVLVDFGLEEAADRPVMTYSGGMQRRLDLAMTLFGQPRILFLDEPTTGLDPRSRRQLWGDIRGLVTTGVTVFLTTQYLEEADALADRLPRPGRQSSGERVGHDRRGEPEPADPGRRHGRVPARRPKHRPTARRRAGHACPTRS
jgi:ABC-2 type transport system ATP-binding protein